MTTEPAATKPRRRKVTVTATALAEHLGLSRQRITGLADEGIIARQGDDGRYDQDAARLAYLNWLRRERTTSSKGAAEAEFLKQKTMALEIRTMERLGKLVPSFLLDETVDVIVGMYRAELAVLPAAYTRDIRERRRLEGLIRELLKRVANEAGRRGERGYAAEGTGKAVAFGLNATDAAED